jgi:hypothetical protein
MKSIEIAELISAIEEDEDFREKCRALYDEHMGDGVEYDDEEEDEDGMPEFLSAGRYAVVWG